MTVEYAAGWNIFEQISVDHGDSSKVLYPGYDDPYDDDIVR